MYCKKCGTEIDEDSIFCYLCGTKVTAEAEPKEQEQPKTTPTSNQEKTFKKEELEGMGYKPILIIIAIALGFFSLLAVLLFNLI